MSRVRRIYQEVAADYDQVGPAFYAMNGAELVKRTGLRAGQRVLDAGCGRGACLFPAADAVGPAGRVSGIDLTPAMVEQVAAEIGDRTNVTVAVGDAMAPDFPDGAFDAVLSGFVLRLLPDPAAALAAYARLLRPGGRLGASIYASTFSQEWSQVRQALDAFISPAEPAGESALDSAEGLAGLLTAAGFTEVEVVDEPFDIWLADPEEWWRYLWASGYRGMMDRIPAQAREQARIEACALAEQLREPDGRLRLPQRVRYATASR